MDFSKIKKVETVDIYLDVAIKRSKKRAGEIRDSLNSKMTRLSKSRKIEIEKINEIKKNLVVVLDRIIKTFPNLDDLTEFYKRLINLELDILLIKKCLGACDYAKLSIEKISSKYLVKVKKCTDLKGFGNIYREYLGRVSSFMKQIKKELLFLEDARLVMKKFPSIKEDMKTIAISGFPNVGKSTLLTRLTNSTPEINNYSFTTKRLMMGYMKKSYNKIQVIDTPGTLNRLDKMNKIETLAYLAMKYVSDVIIFVIDLTLTYPLKDQVKLYNSILKFGKPVYVYLSKTDILDRDEVNEFKNSNKKMKFLDFEEIKKLDFIQ